MAHFQERRSGSDRRKQASKDRRSNIERRLQTEEELELLDRARYKAWMDMRDKTMED